jgi:hypothetical protein
MGATQFDHTIRLYRIVQKIVELGDELSAKILKGNKCKEEQTSLNLLVALLDVLKGHVPGSYNSIASFRLYKLTDDLLTVPQGIEIYVGSTLIINIAALPSNSIITNVQYIVNQINATSVTFDATADNDRVFINSTTAGDTLNGQFLNVITDTDYLNTFDSYPFQFGQTALPVGDNCLTQEEVDALFLFIEKKYCMDFGVYGQVNPVTIENPSLTPTPPSNYLKQEDNFYILLEDGFKIKLEDTSSQSYF